MINDPEKLTTTPDGRPAAEQPKWRQDFPIDWPQDHYISRRDFTKFMVLTSFAFVVGQFWILIQNYLRKRKGQLPVQLIAQVGEIPVGGSVAFNYPQEHNPRILVRLDESTFVAYEQQCTHLTCPIIPQFESGKFHCPCHEGYFDMRSGRPLAGPPRRPLQRVKLVIRRGAIYAVALEKPT